MFIRSIRWRLQVWYGLILLAVLTAFGFVVYRLQEAQLMSQFDEGLQRRLTAIVGVVRPVHARSRPPATSHLPPAHQRNPIDTNPPPGPRRQLPLSTNEIRLPPEVGRLFDPQDTNGYYYMFCTPAGQVVARSDNAPVVVKVPIPHGPAGAAAIRTRGVLREIVQGMPGLTVLVGHSLEQALLDLRRTAWRLSGAGCIVLILGLLGGWWLATRAIGPIQLISDTAGKIAAGDLSQRISLEDTESELGRLAGVLNSTFSRLEAAFTQQGRFTSDAAHELRTPVTVLLTQIQTALARPREVADYQRTLQVCQRNVQRMRRLIESMLELARLDAGQDTLRQTPFDVSSLIQECVELLRPLALERGIKVETELITPMSYEGDRDRLAQVITNLVTNAISYNREGGEVRLATQHKDDFVAISVTDTGRGIASQDLPHIFERFYRADLSRAAQSGQTGLGLAISKAIVEAHGGRIQVLSEAGKGSTFTVYLPGLGRRRNKANSETALIRPAGP